jgi:hypothetical protein
LNQGENEPEAQDETESKNSTEAVVDQQQVETGDQENVLRERLVSTPGVAASATSVQNVASRVENLQVTAQSSNSGMSRTMRAIGYYFVIGLLSFAFVFLVCIRLAREVVPH